MRAGRSIAGMVRMRWHVAYVNRWRQVVANQGVVARRSVSGIGDVGRAEMPAA
jgi:hypothetical protein